MRKTGELGDQGTIKKSYSVAFFIKVVEGRIDARVGR